MSFVSKMYPKGIQFRNLSNVSRLEPTKGAFCELSYFGKGLNNINVRFIQTIHI